MSLVAAGAELVMQSAHEPSRLDRDLVLCDEAALAVAREAGEQLDPSRQLFQRELDLLARVEVDDEYSGEIGDDQLLREFVLRHTVQIVERLATRLLQVLV